MKKYQTSRIAQAAEGFSLLELLLVVAILATIATFGLSLYRQRTVNVKITRAAAEVQQILQAGSAFYADKKQWPIEQSQMGEEFEKNYLPFGKTRKNPWEEIYSYKPFSETGDTKKTNLFQVETILPTENTASQMAAQLPNSEIEKVGNAYKVKSQVAIPGQDRALGNPYMIVEIGEIGNGKPGMNDRSRYLNALMDDKNRSRRVNFDCPEGREKGLFAVVQSVRSVGKPSINSGLASFEVSSPLCDKIGCEIILNMRYWERISDWEWLKGSNVVVQYIAYCK